MTFSIGDKVTHASNNMKNEVQLFHVSRNRYEVGDNIGNFEATHFFTRLSQDVEFCKLEEAFEKRRPSHAPSRLNSVFAFDSVDICEIFWAREFDSGKTREYYASSPNYYRVSVSSFSKSPMQLIDYAAKPRARGGKAAQQSLIDEYWSPKEQWYLWEYFSREARIEEVVAANKDTMRQKIIEARICLENDKIKRLIE